jgi:hypothetical protein
MGSCLVKLNHGNLVSQLLGEGINKLLKVFGVEMGVLLSKMPPTQRFHYPIQPKVVPLPLHLHHWLDPKSSNHLTRLTFESEPSFVLTQVAHPLAFAKVGL